MSTEKTVYLLCECLTMLCDIRSGYSDRDLHKSPAEFIAECRQHLKLKGITGEGAWGADTPQDRAAEHGCYIGHDHLGWYIAGEHERATDDEGTSVGFDGRPHFATEEEAADALDNGHNV